MGLLGLDLKEAGNDFVQRARDPFDKYFAAPLDMKSALERNDFPSGFIISEFQEGRELRAERVVLKGNAMPHIPFTHGGTQKIVKDYYPGNSEPSVQVLGPRENNITIKGRLKAKALLKGVTNIQQRDLYREYPTELQQQIDAIRIRGNLIKIELGEFVRYGFIEETAFQMTTLADLEYEINFTIIGFNPPSDCKVINSSREVPFEINKALIAAVTEYQEEFGNVPDGFDRALADQLKDAISQIATSINLVTGFVDTVLNEVDSLFSAIERAKGLIKHTMNTIRSQMNRVSNFPVFGKSDLGAGPASTIAASYINANHISGSLTGMYSLTDFLASLRDQLDNISATEPLGRHKIQIEDTLQKIAIKFYNDGAQWKEIYDHNKLNSTELVVGDVLEVPRIK